MVMEPILLRSAVRLWRRGSDDVRARCGRPRWRTRRASKADTSTTGGRPGTDRAALPDRWPLQEAVTGEPGGVQEPEPVALHVSASPITALQSGVISYSPAHPLRSAARSASARGELPTARRAAPACQSVVTRRVEADRAGTGRPSRSAARWILGAVEVGGGRVVDGERDAARRRRSSGGGERDLPSERLDRQGDADHRAELLRTRRRPVQMTVGVRSPPVRAGADGRPARRRADRSRSPAIGCAPRRRGATAAAA